jgi:hypothetical protein
MNVNVDIYDIASPEEVKEAALDAIKSLIIRQFSGSEDNLNRLIINLSISRI